MTKMTYGEQLKHPNWQRLRLERLTAAGWQCQACADTETTLHVHHRRYIKGRMAWEYPAENFAVLCEQCHALEHEIDDHIKMLGADMESEGLAALLAGMHLASGRLRSDDELAMRYCGHENFKFGAILEMVRLGTGRQQRHMLTAISGLLREQSPQVLDDWYSRVGAKPDSALSANDSLRQSLRVLVAELEAAAGPEPARATGFD